MSSGVPMCSAAHCSALSTKINATCKKNGWPVNHLILVCDPDTGDCCNCTCSCTAYGTEVLVPNSQKKEIQKFALGDPVVAFAPDGSRAELSVLFSNGTSPKSTQPEMLFLKYLTGESEREIIVTLDHTFLLPDGKLIRARMLRNKMQIMAADGTNAEITATVIKPWTGGVWNIATSSGNEQPASLEGHLIDTNGVLSGDYAAQLWYNEFSHVGLAVPQGSMPEMTTRAYDAAAGADGFPAAQASPPSKPIEDFLSNLGPANMVAGKAGSGVLLHGDHNWVLQPPGAVQGYLTATQANEVSARLQPESEKSANAMSKTQWLCKIFHALYSGITFVIDAPSRDANAYSFELDGDRYVVIQGGLIRATPLDWQGLALILAYSVSRFPEDPEKALTCKPQADYESIGVLTSVFYPLYAEMIFDAYNSIKGLFDEITDKNDDPVSGCHATSLACRIATYSAAMQYMDLPQCAGGPKPPLLEVLGAEGRVPDSVIVSFNELLEPRTANDPRNYAFSPALKVQSAHLDPRDGSKVKLSGVLTSGTKYELVVDGVLSAAGYPLDPAKNTAKFQMP